MATGFNVSISKMEKAIETAASRFVDLMNGVSEKKEQLKDELAQIDANRQLDPIVFDAPDSGIFDSANIGMRSMDNTTEQMERRRKLLITALSRHIGEDAHVRQAATEAMDAIRSAAAPYEASYARAIHNAQADVEAAQARLCELLKERTDVRMRINGAIVDAFRDAVRNGEDISSFAECGVDRPRTSVLSGLLSTRDSITDVVQMIDAELAQAARFAQERKTRPVVSTERVVIGDKLVSPEEAAEIGKSLSNPTNGLRNLVRSAFR